MLNRYKLDRLVSERKSVSRYRGRDTGPSGNRSVPVIILREAGEPLSGGVSPPKPTGTLEPPPTVPAGSIPKIAFPSLIWERTLLEQVTNLAIPRVIQQFHADGNNYLIEEAPEGKLLLEAWHDPETTNVQRFAWMRQIVEGLQRLHMMGVVVYGLSPASIIVTASGQAMFTSVDQFLPLPIPAAEKSSSSPYLAPEFLAADFPSDVRADQFSIGATLFALFLGRELTDEDFIGPGLIKPFNEFFPDCHPMINRLISKLCQIHPDQRFPSHDRKQTDPTGIAELLEILDRVGKNLDRVTLDIACWTTTGAVRTGNEDAVSIVHGRDSLLEEMDDYALLILADGMGGMECGEIASSLAVHTVRDALMREPPFGTGAHRKPTLAAPTTPEPTPGLAPDVSGTAVQFPALKTPPPAAATEMQMPAVKLPPDTAKSMPAFDPTMTQPQPIPKSTPTIEDSNQGIKWLKTRIADRESTSRESNSHQRRLMTAIREANQKVFNAARSGFGHQGMGATLEVVVVDVNCAIVGHVGDSRVYHCRGGKLQQITHDQTYVYREVAEGRMTPEQAETHPRRSELQQAVGGRVDIFPDFYTQELKVGDWLVICSDGLPNSVKAAEIQAILSKATSASQASRRLVNRANQMNATDNVSVIVVRIV